MRHYGFLAPSVTAFALASSNVDDGHAIGAGLFASGITGLVIGNHVARKYNYTQGDIESISSLTLITGALGVAIVAEAIDSENSGLFLLPAATAIAGTAFGQKAVRGIYLSKSQGNIVSVASGGAALVGLGLMVVVEAESSLLYLGVPAAMALIAHQAMFHSYKRKTFLRLS